MVESLQESNSALHESEEMFRTINASANDAIITIDNEGKVLFWNKAAEKMFSYSSKEIVGRSLYKSIVPVKYHERYLKGFRRFQDTGQGLYIGKTVELTAINRDGKEFPIEHSVSAVKIKGKWNAIGIIRDITERKKMEEELIKAKKLESVGILAGGIAHDFNNNLQAILSSIMLAEACIDSKDEISKILEEARKVVLRSKNLTRQLLTFSKGGEPIITTISVAELIKDSTNLTLSGSNVRCEVDIQDELWSIEADKGQMNQVISNLVINADQAMTEGGIIRLRAENTNEIPKDSLPIEGRCVKITIEDNGIGISQENLQKIFDPYFTTKQKGSGLGLAITYSIIKKHGGYITVESEIGVGTTFHIYLPASLQKEIQKRSDPSALLRIDTKPHEVNDEEGKPSKSKGKILLMDDEDMIRFVTGEHLRRLKYEVETVEDGSEVLELYKSASESGNPFDAVIMDLTIPGGMGGREAIERLYEIDPEVRAIVVSGYANDPIMANYKKYGFCGVLAKPYETQELDETLQKVIMGNEE
jgi:PAS domain S-box-containing protein